MGRGESQGLHGARARNINNRATRKQRRVAWNGIAPDRDDRILTEIACEANAPSMSKTERRWSMNRPWLLAHDNNYGEVLRFA